MADTDLVDQLLAQPGLYLGPDVDPTQPSEGRPSLSRVNVSALPGNVGVAFDYEVLSHDEARPRPHLEHTLLARTADGLVLFSAHIHSNVATLLLEKEPGYFVAPEGASPFPMAIRLEVPEKGRITYSWSYAEPGGELKVRDHSDLKLVT
jgi:hypothetical protein